MVSETSAQVGRVATRLRVSAVVATVAIIAGAAEVATLRRGYSRPNGVSIDVSTRCFHQRPLVFRKREVYRDLRFHFDGLAVQDVGSVSPLTHRFNCSVNQHGMSREYP